MITERQLAWNIFQELTKRFYYLNVAENRSYWIRCIEKARSGSLDWTWSNEYTFDILLKHELLVPASKAVPYFFRKYKLG